MARTSQYQIPVIDMKSDESDELIIGACEEWGCFRIVNFGGVLEDDESVMAEMKLTVRSLLELPAETKRRNRAVVSAERGYIAPKESDPLYEALLLYDMANPQAVDGFCDDLGATPHHRDVIKKYAKAVNELMKDIAAKIGRGFGLDGLSIEDWACQFRMNKFNFSPETVRSSGVQLHTDSSFFTVVQDDESVGGLEVMRRSGEIVAVDPWPGTFLVNLGDMAPVWSNGRFLNVKHRVMCKEASTRISIASFLFGPEEATIEPPAKLIDEKHPRLFAPFTFRDFRNIRVSKGMQTGEALDRFRISS